MSAHLMRHMWQSHMLYRACLEGTSSCQLGKISVSSSNVSLPQPGIISKTGTREKIVFLNKTHLKQSHPLRFCRAVLCCHIKLLTKLVISDNVWHDQKNNVLQHMLTGLDYVSFFFFFGPPKENVLSLRLLRARSSSLHWAIKHWLWVVTHSQGCWTSVFFIYPFILSI